MVAAKCMGRCRNSVVCRKELSDGKGEIKVMTKDGEIKERQIIRDTNANN
jgi:hypothetical protein